MFTLVWSVVFTVAFALTGVYCLVRLVTHREHSTPGGGLGTHQVIDLTHALMSAAMILMVWVAVGDVWMWAQVALFAVLALALIPSLSDVRTRAGRVDLLGHALLDVAMIWMLAAMPLLMAGMATTAGSGAAPHHGTASGDALTATPLWADVTNIVVTIAVVAAGGWWLVRAARGPQRLHSLCHAFMAAGMATMLVLMNA